MIFLALLLAVVTSPYAPPTYACNGSTAVFTINFPYLTNTDVVLTSTTAAGVATTLAQGTDFTLNVSSSSSTALATLASPASTCPTGNQLKIFRATAKTQPYSFRMQTSFNPALLELAYDRQLMITQETAAGTAASGDISQATVLIPGTTTAVNISSLLAGSPIAAKAFGVLCDGSDEHARIQQCLTSATQCLMPPSNSCSSGSTTLSVPTGHRLVGHGKQSTTITYAGTGCALSFDNNDGGGMEKIHINVTNTAATVRNMCVTNAVGPTLRLSFPEVMLVGASNPPVTGAYCVFMNSTTGNSLYYNLFTQLVTLRCDRGVELLAGAGTGGVNANWFLGYSSNGNVTGTYFDGLSGDNYVQGHCNASGTTFGQVCAVIGNGVLTSSGNELHLVSDTGGSWGSVVNIQNHAVNSMIFSDNESSGADTFSADSTNFIFSTAALGAASRHAYLPDLFSSAVSNFGASLFIGGAVRTTGTAPIVKTNADYVITQFDRNVCSGGLTGPHTFTLPNATGSNLEICDSDGTITGTNTISIAPPTGGSGRINGSASNLVLNAPGKNASCSAPSFGLIWSCKVSP